MLGRFFDGSFLRGLLRRTRTEEEFLRQLRPFSEYSEVIKTDTMGRGVAATEPIAGGTVLGTYPGRRVSVREFAEKGDFTARAVRSAFRLGADFIVDPTDFFGYVPDRPEARIALINEPPPGIRFNTVPVTSSASIWFVTIADISPGMQLFTTYGDQYQRHYPCDEHALAKPKFLETELLLLKQVGSRHPWLVEGIRQLSAD